MARSVRVYYRSVSGRAAFNFNLNGFDITNRSTVLVTAAPVEINAPQGLGFPSNFPDEARLNVHGPDVRVSNVVPHGPPAEAPGVEFVLTTAAPTGVAVTIILLEPWETAFRVG